VQQIIFGTSPGRVMLRRIFNSRRRKRLVAGLALFLVLAVVVAVVLETRSASSTRTTSGSANASGSATVRRRDLVETDTESGTVSYSDPQTVYDRLSGTITSLPRVGQVIKPGGTLFRVDGEPVILMKGSTPAYRGLNAADSDGADIEQLNRSLVKLGFDADGIVLDDEWQAATTTGVELLQASLGETETGSLSLGQIVFLPGDQLVSTVDATVGATGSGGGADSGASGSSAADTVTRGTPRAPEFVSLEGTSARDRSQTAPTPSTPTSTSIMTTPTHRTPPVTTTSTTTSTVTSTTPAKTGSQSATAGGAVSKTLSGLTALLKAESAQLKAQAAQLKADKKSSTGSADRSASGSGSSGSGGSATAVLQTTATQLIVTVDLSASSQSEGRVGEAVTVELPAGNTVAGTITAVSSVAESSSSSSGSSGGPGSVGAGGSSGSSSTIPVTIRLKGHHRGAGLDQAAVSVHFAQAKARHVLSVPVTALVATAGGHYGVQEATAPYAPLPVTTGLFAAGYVQISGPGIHAGLRVTDSQG
jgi:hypothetical protein